ncbi:MAG: adenylosuccinate synthase [Deltaproteobacteria bacterium]|nr:adenylosuccinate synthase [Deltaproteobacteria bacterium]
MANLIVVGTQWGDEGKGKLIDLLAEFADLIVRFQGGANAGHTLKVGDAEELITHLIPSGIMHSGKRIAIGPGVVVDPETLVSEIEAVQKRGLLQDTSVLLLSNRAHVVMPYHRLLDAAREMAKGSKKIGTTLRGIGPCLEDKVSRTGVRMCDLIDPQVLEDKVLARLPEINALLKHYGRDPVEEKDLLPTLNQQAVKLAPFVSDVGEAVRQEMDRGKNILFEGAQGTLLDVDHGTYPFVTSSNTVASAACTAVGFGAPRIDSVVGVAKAYTTRVGEGPFPTELMDEKGVHLQEKGAEFGATTGRPRRCGWLDMVALRYTLAVNGCTSLCLTKLDVLAGTNPIKIAVGYKLSGKEIQSFPADIRAAAQVEPVYEEIEGWDEDISDLREKEALPVAAQRYISRIEMLLNLPVDIVSVGPGRRETIVIQNPFRRG